MDIVNYLHIRRYGVGTERTRSDQPIQQNQPNARGGITIAYSVEPHDYNVLVTAGVARCSDQDNYDKHHGRTLAFERLYGPEAISFVFKIPSRLLYLNNEPNGWELPYCSHLAQPMVEGLRKAWLTSLKNKSK